jgi:hypothetical protein
VSHLAHTPRPVEPEPGADAAAEEPTSDA